MPIAPSGSVDVVVVGAGISGLLAAYRAASEGLEVIVLEARDRVGGRCHSMEAGGVHVDLGAAWHWEEHKRVPRILEEFSLERFRQHEPGVAIYEPQRDRPVQKFEWPDVPPPSWRVAGGAQAIANAIAAELPDAVLHLGSRVRSVDREGGEADTGAVVVSGEQEDHSFMVRADICLCAVPPRLVAHTIDFGPDLPVSIRSALRRTPTWMSHSLKAGVVYERPFWREDGLSGRIRSFAGPIGDWHDATPPSSMGDHDGASGAGALFGFGPPGAVSGVDAATVRTAIIEQLTHCFGPDAADPVAVDTHDWTADSFTTPEQGSACQGQHPEPVPELASSYWNGQLHFIAAETAQDHPGFLDGAIEAAERWDRDGGYDAVRFGQAI
ncbi:monoamine oxidase [Longibacter salinarum]|uniref:Monoamine oxidase n=1 Tax=Longibacter salinarum TaxID=1850348 RepID=A0A2A8D0Y9_9BACT|nr:FAD-dependent oxidoreductase [Longibacter salinarum]PEN14473.1 monoamine oxidase [Longibacter salinarum]